MHNDPVARAGMRSSQTSDRCRTRDNCQSRIHSLGAMRIVKAISTHRHCCLLYGSVHCTTPSAPACARTTPSCSRRAPATPVATHNGKVTCSERSGWEASNPRPAAHAASASPLHATGHSQAAARRSLRAATSAKSRVLALRRRSESL